MKKIIYYSLLLLSFIFLTSCNKIGNPTIKYIDENGNEKIETVFASKDEEYLTKIINILNSLKPENYDYQILSNVAVTFNCELYVEGQNKTTIQYSYNSIDMLVFDNTNNIIFNKINSNYLLKDLNNTSLDKIILNNSMEYIYKDITYVNQNNDKYTTTDNNLEENIISRFNVLQFLSLNETYIKNYNLYIYDCSKESIKFVLDYGKFIGESSSDKAYIFVSPTTGLVTSVQINYSNLIDELLAETYPNKKFLYENMSNIINNTQFSIIYTSIPNIKLTNEEIEQYKKER